ncbi:MAG: NifU family protein [Proteobacteria bacterium]|nr:NifU family protein [Pseudomonadota bacterium]
MNLTVDPQAQSFLADVIKKHDIDDLHLQVMVKNPGTPIADCFLNFCERDEAPHDAHEFRQSSYSLFVAQQDEKYLDDASIEYEESDTGGQLNIKAPKLKGKKPDDDAPLHDRVQYFIDTELNPSLAMHGGNAKLTTIDDGYAFIEFGGGCNGCGMAGQTLSMGMETKLLRAFPELKGLLDGTDHSTGTNPYY